MTFRNETAGTVILDLIRTIQSNKDYLSEVDGKIGDGDHGINMNKGFTITEEKLGNRAFSMSDGFRVLGETLMEDIGGSMGPLYGVFFEELSLASGKKVRIDEKVFGNMLQNAADAVQEIGDAQVGDKTLIDTLLPALDAYNAACAEGKSFAEALEDMRQAAKDGWRSTEDMVARIGRASRLGERSRGVLDAGATSCYLILDSMARSMIKMLNQE